MENACDTMLNTQIALYLCEITHACERKGNKEKLLHKGSGLVGSFLLSLLLNFFCCGLCSNTETIFFPASKSVSVLFFGAQVPLIPILSVQISPSLQN